LALQDMGVGYNARMLLISAEFWKHIPPSEPFRVLLGDMRDKLYNTRERMRQLLANGRSDIPVDDTFTDASQVIVNLKSNGTIALLLQIMVSRWL
jgi:hypothetical protein